MAFRLSIQRVSEHPTRQIMLVGDMVFGLFFQHLTSHLRQCGFFLQSQTPDQNSAAQEHKVCVEHIAAAVIVNICDLPVPIHILNLRAINAGFARLVNKARQQIESTAHAKRTKLDSRSSRYGMSLMVVAWDCSEGLRIHIEPCWHAESESIGRQFP